MNYFNISWANYYELLNFMGELSGDLNELFWQPSMNYLAT